LSYSLQSCTRRYKTDAWEIAMGICANERRIRLNNKIRATYTCGIDDVDVLRRCLDQTIRDCTTLQDTLQKERKVAAVLSLRMKADLCLNPYID